MRTTRYYILALLLPLLALFGCKQEAPSNASTGEGEGFEMSLEVRAPEMKDGLRAHLSSGEGDTEIKAYFKADDRIALFVIQDGKAYDLANVGFASVTDEGKKATLTFTLPAGVDASKPIDVIGFDGFLDFGYKSGSKVNRSDYIVVRDGKILINVKPITTQAMDKFEAPVVFKAMGITPTAAETTDRFVQFEHIGVYEVIYFTNNSNDAIRAEVGLSEKGKSRFGIKKSWAEDSKLVGTDLHYPLLDLVTGKIELSGERTPRSKYMSAPEVAAGASTVLVNWYIPQEGVNLPEMELVAKVNFKNHLSATTIPAKDFAMEVGKAYAVSGSWDGTQVHLGKVTIVEPQSITLSATTATLAVGEEQTLTATVLPAETTNKSVTWESSNEQVVSVQEGVIKGLKAGNATITAKTTNGKEAKCEVTVKEIEVTNISLSETQAELKINGTLQLTATLTPVNATNKTVAWSSSAEAIAEVTQDGHVTAKSAGEATITAATANGKQATCTITVKDAKLEITSITIEEATVDTGSSVKLKYTILPAEAANLPLTWSSSEPSIATVENGVVKGLKVGEVTITATAENGVKGTAKVTVKKSDSSIDDVPGTIL